MGAGRARCKNNIFNDIICHTWILRYVLQKVLFLLKFATSCLGIHDKPYRSQDSWGIHLEKMGVRPSVTLWDGHECGLLTTKSGFEGSLGDSFSLEQFYDYFTVIETFPDKITIFTPSMSNDIFWCLSFRVVL